LPNIYRSDKTTVRESVFLCNSDSAVTENFA